MTPAEFALKWMGSTQTERAASQEHFIDLCRMRGVLTPNEADPSGRDYAFEKGAEKVGGGRRGAGAGQPGEHRPGRPRAGVSKQALRRAFDHHGLPHPAVFQGGPRRTRFYDDRPGCR
jgi:hypothetical protein